MTVTSVPAGHYGAQAANTYRQQVTAGNSRHTVPVRYTADFRGAEATNDLFAYVHAFDRNGDHHFTPDEITEATGLDLNTALQGQPDKIVQLWDANQDGKVDDVELATGILSIDGANGPPDGTLTTEKRAATEENLFAFANLRGAQQARLSELSQNPLTANPQGYLNAVFRPSVQNTQGPTSDLSLSAEDSQTLLQGLEGLPPDILANMDQNTAQLAHTQGQSLYNAFQMPLQQIRQSARLDEQYQRFQLSNNGNG